MDKNLFRRSFKFNSAVYLDYIARLFTLKCWFSHCHKVTLDAQNEEGIRK